MKNRKYTSVTICLQGLAHYKPILVSHFCKWYKLPECQMHKLFTACPPHGHLLALRRAAAVLRPAIGRRHSGPGWSSACSLLCLTLANWRNCPAQPSPAQPTDGVLGYFWRGCCVLNSAAHMLSSPSMGTA